MSRNNAGTPPIESVATLESVNIGMKRQQKMLIGLAGLCVISVPAALLALVLLPTRVEPAPQVEAASAAELRALQEQLSDLDARYTALLAQSTQTQGYVDTLSQQVAGIDINDERNALARVQQLLVRQEQDYQSFLGTLEGGLYNFHMMIPHSRGWWDDYKADLMDVMALSKAREEYVETMSVIEPQGINQ